MTDTILAMTTPRHLPPAGKNATIGDPPAVAFAAPVREFTDKEILEQVIAGQAAAFEQIVSRYERPVFFAAKRVVGNEPDAEDITQESFLQAFRKLDSFDLARPFKPWLLRITFNLAISHLRKHRPAESMDDLQDQGIEFPAPGSSSPILALERADLQRRIASAVEQLPPQTRAAFQLRYAEEMTMEEIATATGKNASTVAVLLHRARLQLRRLLAAPDECRKEQSS